MDGRELWGKFTAWLIGFGWNLLSAGLIFLCGWWLAGLAAKRRAQDASGAPGSAARRISATGSGSFTRVPPFTGSMMTTGLLCRRAVS